MHRLAEAYVWPGMQRSIRARLRTCPVCMVPTRQAERVPMGEMPLASYPLQIVGADLIGPLSQSSKGSRYILTMIDHCSGWAEAYPLPDKTSKSVWTVFATDFLPRYGAPEILITDNGKEFTARDWELYLAQLGVKHNVTPVHRQPNGKTERFNHTLKEILQRLINNAPTDWEDRLGDSLLAYINYVSTLLYHVWSRHSNPIKSHVANTARILFGNRLDDLATPLKTARLQTETSRRYNRERLAKKANANAIAIGDSVVIRAEERTTFTSRWDPRWEVTRTRGPVIWVRQQQTGKEKFLNREQVRLADRTISWDDINPRPLRAQYRPRARLGHQETISVPHVRMSGTTHFQEQPMPAYRPNDDTPTRRCDRAQRKRRRISAHDPSQGESLHCSAPQPELTAPDTPSHTRPIRSRQLSRRARELIDDSMDTDDLSLRRHFLKRNTAATAHCHRKRA